VRLKRLPRRQNATEPTPAEEERIREGKMIRVEVRDGFVETSIAVGTFVRKGNPVLQPNGAKHDSAGDGNMVRSSVVIKLPN
jgi:hypothetical protein